VDFFWCVVDGGNGMANLVCSCCFGDGDAALFVSGVVVAGMVWREV